MLAKKVSSQFRAGTRLFRYIKALSDKGDIFVSFNPKLICVNFI